MAAKSFFIICATACFVKTISSQCIGAANRIAGTLAAEELLANNACGNLAYGAQGYGIANSITPTSGGGFAVTSYSPITPTGITVFSENAIEGSLAVNGQLPFLGAIALEGALPSAGAGGINYGCGNGAIAIVSEVAPTVGNAAAAGYPAGLGYGPGLANVNGVGYQGLGGIGLNRGLGCGAVY